MKKKKSLKLKGLLFSYMWIVSIGLLAQNITVKGTVTDANNEPVIGATIMMQDNASLGTVTDIDGNYTLSNVPGNATLQFSYVGLTTQAVAVNGRTTINVVLEADSELLEEVVVTALGIKRDTRALGYATSTIQGGDLTKAGLTTSPLSALYGKAAGVGIQATASGPMGGVQIKVRGAQGLESSANTRPLFVIDGVPMYDQQSSMSSRGYDPLNSFDYGSAINDINSEDIESMEILKGAKASILYGSQGANGVVLITTKSGVGTRGLGVNITYGLETEVPYTLIDFQNEYGSGTNEYSRSLDPNDSSIRRVVDSRFNFGPKFDGSPIKFFDGTIRPYEAQKNNYLDLFRRGSTSSLSAAISGGNEKGSMRLALSTFDYEGTMQNQGMKKNTLSFNGQMQASKFARFEFIQNLYSTKAQNRRPNIQQLVAFGTFNRDYDIKAAMNAYKDENGYMYTLEKLGNLEGDDTSWGWPQAFTSSSGGFFQMLWNNNENRNYDNRVQSNTSAIGDFKFFPFLNLRLQAALNYNDTEYIKNDKVVRKIEETGKYEGGKFSFARDRNLIQRYQGTLSFDKEFDNELDVTAFIGGVYQRSEFKSVGVGTYGNFKFPNFWSLSNGDSWPANYDSRVSSYEEGADAIYSMLGQATIGWKNTYFLELQAANDWASTLPKENRSYFYPGASFTWIFTESFQIPRVDYGKFRLSWADVGRPASRYYALRAYEIGTLPAPQTNINDVTGPTDLFSGNLKPERKREWETGFNVRMFDRRLEVDFSYYNNINYNEIMGVPLSAATGANNIRINAGKVQRTGIELYIKGALVATPKFQWELKYNLARQWDKILKLYPGITQKVTSTNGIYRIDAEGERMGNLWMQDYVKDEKGNRIVSSNGLYQLSSDADARINVGSINPDFYGGLISDFSFQGNWGTLLLSMGIDYKFGGKVLSYSNFYLKGNGLAKETLKYRDTANGGMTWTETLTDGTSRERHDGLILPGVKADGTPNDIMITAYDYYSTFIHDMSTGWQPDAIQDNSYIKFREVSLGYTLPKRISNTFKLEKLMFSITARNLFYLYKTIDHIDSEALLGTSISDQWVEYSNYPSSRTYGFKINVSF
jgi:iron complex outermembrane receptor protein